MVLIKLYSYLIYFHPKLIACMKKYEEHFCANFYKVYLFLDFIGKDFRMELENHKPFTEDEIWFWIDSIVGAMAILQKNMLQHGSLKFEHIYLVKGPDDVMHYKVADANLMSY
jgi:hypothetical protein